MTLHPQASLKCGRDNCVIAAGCQLQIQYRIAIAAGRDTFGTMKTNSVWEVELWAARLDRPARNRDIGEVHVSMEDGKVVKNDLKPDRLH